MWVPSSEDKVSGRGDFSFEFSWVLTPFPQNSFGWEYKPRSSLSTHALYRSDSKDPDIHNLDGWMPETKTHPACTIHENGMWLPQWLNEKNGHKYKILTQNGEPQRYSWGNKKKKSTMNSVHIISCQFRLSIGSNAFVVTSAYSISLILLDTIISLSLLRNKGTYNSFSMISSKQHRSQSQVT